MNAAESDTIQRLTWLYGDPVERIRANHNDVMKWRHIGGEPYIKQWSEMRFTRGVCNIAKAALR